MVRPAAHSSYLFFYSLSSLYSTYFPLCSILWSAGSSDQMLQCNIAPMKGFVHEVLRHSRTSGSILQTALCYLEAIRAKVPELVTREGAAWMHLQNVSSASTDSILASLPSTSLHVYNT